MEDRIREVVVDKIIRFGFKGFTMDDIAAELSISKKTVYKYFSSKQELIRSAIHHAVEESTAKMKEAYQKADNNLERLRAILLSSSENSKQEEVFVDLKRHYPEIYEEEFKPHYDYRGQLLIETIEKIYQDNEVQREINVNIILAMLRGFMDELDLNFMLENKISLEEVLKDIQHLILYGVLGKK
ncbi:MAG: TetR/AcrR family transcriptional regulator [Bacillota bacterium]